MTAVTTRPNVTGDGQGKRFSLVLGGRPHRQGPSEVLNGSGDDLGKDELKSGVAAGKLTVWKEEEVRSYDGHRLWKLSFPSFYSPDVGRV